MESTNCEQLRTQLSYDALKPILKHISLKKREQVHWLVPSYRRINLYIPFKVYSVHLAENFLKVDEREWNLGSTNEDHIGENSNIALYNGLEELRQLQTSINFRSPGYFYSKTINKGCAEAFKTLLYEYLRDGTEIEKLTLFEIPECLQGARSKLIKFKVMELNLRIDSYINLENCLPFLEYGSLKRIHFCLRERNLRMLDEPIDWKICRRPIGSSFILVTEYFDYILDVYARLLEENDAVASNIIEMRNDYFSHCVSIPICDNSELVVYSGPMIIKWPPFQWTLRMKVMKRGSTLAKATLIR
uniref:FBD domain-containing protein n=1 Tax=Caenorhabditis tropicalis TaxID=1561998 RepID=A0A1I7TFY4_9PELO